MMTSHFDSSFSNESTPAPRSGNKHKVFHSKMTDAYAISELGVEEPEKTNDTYFEDLLVQTLGEINVMFEKVVHTFYAPYGLTFVQIPVLMTLFKNGPMTVSQLGRTLEIGSSNITPLCKRLEKAGLVTRNRDTVDQRVVYINITDHARNILHKISMEIRNSIKVQLLNQEQQDSVIKGMELLKAYMGALLESNTVVKAAKPKPKPGRVGRPRQKATPTPEELAQMGSIFTRAAEAEDQDEEDEPEDLAAAPDDNDAIEDDAPDLEP
ncbi:MAG: MarR family winged helix-turn-helix transcriptional regulator [Oscillospiraceae bacterium]|nr:MarR family winged helix-turn-helix transcriptional regulator [Oscillospiraceae bacterium]